MCCCTRLHRHQIHLISYGIVSCGLITTGLVFTVFAIFQKESQIGKVWLAGPTTMVVGLVLAGKVVIDWGPAMLHAREGSIDSRMLDHCNIPGNGFPERQPQVRIKQQHEPKCNGTSSTNQVAQYNNNSIVHSPIGYQPPMHYMHSPVLDNGHPRSQMSNVKYPRSSIGTIPSPRNMERQSPDQCLIYSQYKSSLNKLSFPFNDEKSQSIPRHLNNLPVSSARRSPRPSLANVSNAYSKYSNPCSPSNHSGHSGHSTHSADHTFTLSDTCQCTQYGSMRRYSPPVCATSISSGNPPYQGESFVLNERSYLI